MNISPLAPAEFPELVPVRGVRLAATAAGVKYHERVDVMLAELAPGSSVAGVFTRSLTASAPVQWCRKILPDGRARALIANSGNANAFTGKAGDRGVAKITGAVSEVLNCPQDQVYAASTGVIGEPLPFARIVRVVPGLQSSLHSGNWLQAARAIMTTDTFPKGATAQARINGTTVSISGIAKGSGMIAPDMATMLAFVFTDACIEPAVLQKLLQKTAAKTFNCITVDGDTSTSDTLILAATGRAGNKQVNSIRNLRSFTRALEGVLEDLATQVVRDGEGASKFITIDVGGASTVRAARRIGLAIANSPLVKTAIAGEDANWGRIVMAVGKAGQKADRDALSIAMGGVVICDHGRRRADYDEARVAAHLEGQEVSIQVDVGVGNGKARVWTCDLTHDYITINAEYRS